jgi:hypothetical protein
MEIDKIKDNSKTSIAAVRDKMGQIATFLTPLYFLVADYL